MYAGVGAGGEVGVEMGVEPVVGGQLCLLTYYNYFYR